MKITNQQSKTAGPIVVKTHDNQASIFSNRLELKSLNQSKDSYLNEQYGLLLGKPENISMFGEGKVWSTQAVNEFVASEVQKWNSGENYSNFSVHDKQTQEFIGSLFLKQVSDEFAHVGAGHKNTVEIGYIIDQRFGGKGYGTEVAILGKKYIKHVLATETQTKPVDLAVATVHPNNIGSKKILQKTLKHQEPEEFLKFGNRPRFLFFKPLKPEAISALQLTYEARL
ncbi:Uncharacterised protein [Legionella beliardensis]|uniref:N-acetyltransferase domain-containing protein n=1 Tax=Legionella beliardensis TaxID=91822 RepID=A0A378I234_9GAMM|nr:GNAT family N-acetyltransferase [Legionella beliardensis]STX29239.1 Uncharacterised protein [Legionella beliardensis]